VFAAVRLLTSAATTSRPDLDAEMARALDVVVRDGISHRAAGGSEPIRGGQPVIEIGGGLKLVEAARYGRPLQLDDAIGLDG